MCEAQKGSKSMQDKASKAGSKARRAVELYRLANSD